MILTKEQVEQRINSEKNLVNIIAQREEQFEVIIRDGKNHSGREGSHNLTNEEKLAIGVLANLEGNEVAAEVMGVSVNTARHIRSAQTTSSEGRGTQRYDIDQNLKNKINETLDNTKLTIAEKAADRLLSAMGLLTNDKLENASVKDIATISTQLSQVVRNMSGAKQEDGEKSKVKVVLFAPRQSRETSFDTIEIGID